MPRMDLKPYQEAAKDVLSQYCDEWRRLAHAGALRPERDAFSVIAQRDYHSPPGFDGVPYLCIRIPTGGGKTLLGAHAVGVVGKRLRHDEHPCCLWITPSTTIRDQTRKRLEDPRDPYRLALQETIGADVEIITLEDALTRPLPESAPVVIVTTIQSYRIRDDRGNEEESNRRIYRDSGYQFARFNNVMDEQKGRLALNEAGGVEYSLANALALRQPVVIMDEAHNARTPTSFESLARFAPALVLELSATPELTHNPQRKQYASNVLHAVSALELKNAGMIKLPVQLESRGDWMEVLAASKHQLDALDVKADEFEQRGGPHIRPIALIQAEPRSKTQQTRDVHVVKKALLTLPNVTDEQVKICTGDVNELGDENLMSPDSQVRFVITVNKLREGWDCPFAYVLGSIGNVATATAVEQVLGRVLRMPYATPTGELPLDRAYAFVLSPNVIDTARSLRDKLIESCGFDQRSADDALRVSSTTTTPGLGFDRIPLSAAPDRNALPESLRAKATYDGDSGSLVLNATMTRSEAESLLNVLDVEQDREAVEAYWRQVRPMGAASDDLKTHVEPLLAPQLMVRDEGDRYWLFEPEELDTFRWNLDSCEPPLDDFPLEVTVGEAAAIDVGEKGSLFTDPMGPVRLHQLELIPEGQDWSEVELTTWLDRELHSGGAFRGLTADESQAWFRRAVGYLVSTRDASLPILVRRRFDLADRLRAAIVAHGREQTAEAANALIADRPDDLLTLGDGHAFAISEDKYAPPECQRQHRFQKHAFTLVGDMNEPEMQCATRIDGHENVKRWIRNPSYEAQGGFSLPKAPGRFYPDFIVELLDGTIVLVEYKNKKLAETQSELVKRDIGLLWEARSEGRCRFAWIVERDWQELDRKLAGT